MKRNYKIQNTNYKQITNYKLQITNKDAHELHELTRIAGRKYTGKIAIKGSHGLHQDSLGLQSMTALIKSFCGGVQGEQGCGAPTLLEVVLFLRIFPISSPAPATCTCHLWQKAPLLAAGGKIDL